MSFLKLYRDLDDANLTGPDASQIPSVTGTVQRYVCNDVSRNITCPAATGNPDIAGLGVMVSFTITLLLPIALTVLVMITKGLQYFYTYARATVASKISEGNDILPVWPERYAQCLGKQPVGLSTGERRLKRITNYVLSMTLGLCDQVLLCGIIFLILQIIGLAQGTMNNLDFRTLAILVFLCAATQLYCLYFLQPVLTGLDLPMLNKLQWPYLDTALKDKRKDYEILTHSPKQFRKDFVLYIRNNFGGLHKEARDIIDRVHLNVADGALSGRLTMRVRLAAHIVLLVVLPMELLLIMPSGISGSDKGCSAKCMFGQDGYAFTRGTRSFDTIYSIVLVVLLYLVRVLQLLWPRTMRRVSLLIRLLFHHLNQVWAKARAYLTFTTTLVFTKYPRTRRLIAYDGLMDICLMSTLIYLSFTHLNLFIYLYIPSQFTAERISGSFSFSLIILLVSIVAHEAALLFLPQVSFLYNEAVVAASLSSASQNPGAEGQWTDGQILPLLMLAGTLLVVLQNSSGGDAVDTSKNNRELTVRQRLPSHPAFKTGDKLLDTKIECLVGAISLWDLSLHVAVFHYLFQWTFSTIPLPGDTWSPKGLRHLGLTSDNDTSEEETTTIPQDQRLEIVKVILEQNAYTCFDKVGWNLENVPKYKPDQISTSELDDALEKLEAMKIRLRDTHILDGLPINRLNMAEFLAVAVAVWKYHRTSTAEAENSGQTSDANVTQGHSTT